jgi:hypothetical protein
MYCFRFSLSSFLGSAAISAASLVTYSRPWSLTLVQGIITECGYARHGAFWKPIPGARHRTAGESWQKMVRVRTGVEQTKRWDRAGHSVADSCIRNDEYLPATD